MWWLMSAGNILVFSEITSYLDLDIGLTCPVCENESSYTLQGVVGGGAVNRGSMWQLSHKYSLSPFDFSFFFGEVGDF